LSLIDMGLFIRQKRVNHEAAVLIVKVFYDG